MELKRFLIVKGDFEWQKYENKTAIVIAKQASMTCK